MDHGSDRGWLAGMAGKAFFALAVDPRNPENVVAATTEGLYQRTIGADGKPLWTLRRARCALERRGRGDGGRDPFLLRRVGQGGVRISGRHDVGTAVGTGFPAGDVGRIALAVQPTNPSLVYAMVADGQRRAARASTASTAREGQWKKVANAPDVLPVDNGSSQGDYDLAIAVDPEDANLIYIGGSYLSDHSIGRRRSGAARSSRAAAAYRMTGVSIGTACPR